MARDDKHASGRVIKLKSKIEDKRSGSDLHDAFLPSQGKSRVIAISSGKGGVGKTNVVANLGYVLTRMGKRVIIWDGDLGLGNLDVLLGLTPEYNLCHVLIKEKRLSEIVAEGPGNMMILPAASGIQELTCLSRQQKIEIFTEIDLLLSSVDFMLIDTATGISSNVMSFNATAQEIIIVTSPEPAAITDAYALMKVLSLKYDERHFRLLVNCAGTGKEAQAVYEQLRRVAEKFLDVTVSYLGYVLFDGNLIRGVKQQRVVSEFKPDSPASRCFARIAETLCSTPFSGRHPGHTNFSWEHLLYGNGE